MIGVHQTAIFKPIKQWEVNASLDAYYSRSYSKISITQERLVGWNGIFSISNDFTLNRNKSLFASAVFHYISRGIENFNQNKSFNQLNLAAKWLVFNKKLTLGLHINDVLSSNRPTFISFSNNIKYTYRNYYDQRHFRLSMIYNFGKNIKTESRKNKNTQEYKRLD